MNTAYNVDCMIAMQKIKEKYFDLAVVDPPYGIGMDGGNVGYKGANNFTKKGWDKSPPPPEYFLELFRVSKNQIIFGGNYFDLPPTRCFVIWDKGAGFRGRSYAEAELAWTSFDRNTRIFTRDPLCSGDYKGKIHPTQKPIALYSWIFSKFARPGDKILDTHLGSGSSRIAAYEAGLDFVGFEIDTEYFQEQEKRYDAYISQLSMFAGGYRNIENPWGNVREWRDGIIFSDANISTYNNPANFSDTYNGTGAVVRSNKRHTASDWIKAWGYDTNDPSFIYPSEVGGSETTFVPDYCYYNTGVRALFVGGSYGFGSSAGPFYLYGYNSPTNTYAYLGSRLQKLP